MDLYARLFQQVPSNDLLLNIKMVKAFKSSQNRCTFSLSKGAQDGLKRFEMRQNKHSNKLNDFKSGISEPGK